MRRHLIGAAAAAALIPAAAYPAPLDAGTLDPAFGAGGVVTTDFAAGADEAEAVRILADGRILVAGGATDGADEDFALARYLASGALDATFGTGGRVVLAIGPEDDRATDLLVQPDGRIVVGGVSTSAGVERFALARFTAAGVPDATFGTGGVVVTPFAGQAGIAGLALQADGRIVAAGVHDDPNGLIPPKFALTRYLTSGALDGSFGTGGRVETQIQGVGNAASSVLVQPDGKIVAAGIAASVFGSTFAVVRYQASGALDGTFGFGGVVETIVGLGFAGATDVARQPDGKLLVGGGLEGSQSFILARYQTNGALDGTFGSGGVATAPHNGALRAFTIEPDGRIACTGGTTSLGLARFRANGTLDPSFGTGGLVTEPAGNPGKAIARQVDGMLVVVGADTDANVDWRIARYQGLSEPISFCEGTDANCPCGGGLPTTGCQNAQQTGGVRLFATGYAPNGLGGGTVLMSGTGFPAMQSPAAILIRSRGAETPPVTFGNGLRCISTAGFVRVTAQLASGGTTSMPLNHGAGAGNFHYQLWFRDTPISFCDPSAAFNLSNGLSVPW